MSAKTNYGRAQESLDYVDGVGGNVMKALVDGVALTHEDLRGFQNSMAASAQIAQVYATLALVDELRKIRQIMAPGST